MKKREPYSTKGVLDIPVVERRLLYRSAGHVDVQAKQGSPAWRLQELSAASHMQSRTALVVLGPGTGRDRYVTDVSQRRSTALAVIVTTLLRVCRFISTQRPHATRDAPDAPDAPEEAVMTVF